MPSHFEPDAVRTGPLALILFGLVVVAFLVGACVLGFAR